MIRLLCFVLGLLVVHAAAQAEEVRTRHRGLVLNAEFDLAPGKHIEDGVVLIVHGLLAHNRMELIAALRRLLNARGVSTLAINLSLGIDDRHGFFDCSQPHGHRPADALDEIDAWIGWLKAYGATDIGLLGHSQGGAQVALYAAERRDPSVGSVILLAPATFEPVRTADAYRRRHGTELAPVLARAQELVQTGSGIAPLQGIGFLSCENATATASSVVGWYMPSALRHTPALLPRIETRTLLLMAGADDVVPDLPDAVRPLEGQLNLTVGTLDGADHFFLDLHAEDAADTIAGWLGR